MAGGNTVPLGGYEFTARPQSRWRRYTLLGIWPYFQGDKPKFVITVKRLGPPAESLKVLWRMAFVTAIATYGTLDIPALGTSESYTLREIGGKFLGYTGDTLLVLPIDIGLPAAEQFKSGLFNTLYAFHTTPRAWFSLTLIAGVVMGVVAGLIQFLFRLLGS